VTAQQHRPVTVVTAGSSPRLALVTFVCGCGVARTLSVDHGDGTHSLARFTRALEAAHRHGTWPPPVDTSDQWVEPDDDGEGNAA
jgi:hypothetical protein